MAVTTNLYFDRIWEHDNSTHIFRVISSERKIFWVNSFENGVVTIDAIGLGNIYEISALIAGCFNEDSNFANVISKAFNSEITFTSIVFIFNSLPITITN